MTGAHLDMDISFIFNVKLCRLSWTPPNELPGAINESSAVVNETTTTALPSS